MQNKETSEQPQKENTSPDAPAEASAQAGGSSQAGEVTEKSPGIGPWIGAVVVVIILLVGGLYFWGAQLNKQTAEDELPLDDFAPLELETTTNDSTNPVDIEADLNNFDVDAFEAELDAELEALDVELGNI